MHIFIMFSRQSTTDLCFDSSENEVTGMTLPLPASSCIR